MQWRLRAAEKYGQNPVSAVKGLDEWPWTWFRVTQLVMTLDNVREYASIKKSPNPPREILFDYDRARSFIDENAKRDEKETEVTSA